MRKTVEAFLSETGVSAVSLLSYRRDLEKIMDHFSNRPELADGKELVGYFTEQAEVSSASSISRQVSVVRSFYAYLKKEGIVSSDPMEGIRASDFEKKDRQGLDREEFSRLLAHSSSGFRGMRDRAMLMLLCETGMRVSELVELDLSDLREGCLLCGTARRRRCLTVSPALAGALSKYLAVRALYDPGDTENALFITSRGMRISRQGFWKNLKERAICCGIDKPISPHTLRLSLARHLMEDGKAREEISGLLGNADPASLRNYKIRKKGEQNGSF